MSGALGSALAGMDYSMPDFNKLTRENVATQEAVQGLRSSNALNKIFQQSTGPDGTIDYAKARTLIAQDPSITRGVLDAAGTSLEHQGKQQEHGRAALALVGSTAAYYANRQDADGNPMPATPDEVRDAIGFLGKSGALTPAGAKAAIAAVPNDPAKLGGFLSYVQEQARGAAAQFESALPQGGTRTTAGAGGIQVEQATNRDRRTGRVDAARGSAAVTPTVLSPGERGGQVQTNQGGQQGTVPLVTLVDPYGNPRAQGGAPAAGNPLLGPLPSTDLAGRPNVPGQAGIPSAAPPPAAPPPAAGPAGFNPTALPPQEAERRRADVEQYTAAQQAIPTQQRAVQTLQTARQALDIAATGPGTENLQRALAFLKVVHVPIGSDQATNWAVAHKALLDYARQAGAAASSNEQLRAALGSNASTDIDPTAAMHVVQQEIGRQRQNIAAYQEHGDKTGIGFGKHSADYASNTDPRGFAIDTYSPEELARLKADLLRTGQYAKFARSAGIASRLGLLAKPATE